jgi:hypothetical protein
MSETIKINSEEIEQIKKGDQGLKFNQGFIWVQLGDNSSSGYKLGVRNTENTKQVKREGVPRGSTRVSQVSKPLPRVTTLLVHVSVDI